MTNISISEDLLFVYLYRGSNMMTHAKIEDENEGLLLSF